MGAPRRRDGCSGSDGSLYGVATVGGAYGQGVAFQLLPRAPGGFHMKILYDFQGPPDAGFPYGGLVMDAQGSLYGTTYYDGANDLGSVYKLSNRGSGMAETVLYSFTGGIRRRQPHQHVNLDAQGNLYRHHQRGRGRGVRVRHDLPAGPPQRRVGGAGRLPVHRRPRRRLPVNGMVADGAGTLLRHHGARRRRRGGLGLPVHPVAVGSDGLPAPVGAGPIRCRPATGVHEDVGAVPAGRELDAALVSPGRGSTPPRRTPPAGPSRPWPGRYWRRSLPAVATTLIMGTPPPTRGGRRWQDLTRPADTAEPSRTERETRGCPEAEDVAQQHAPPSLGLEDHRADHGDARADRCREHNCRTARAATAASTARARTVARF